MLLEFDCCGFFGFWPKNKSRRYCLFYSMLVPLLGKFIKVIFSSDTMSPPYDAQSRSRTRHPLSLQSRSRGSRSQCSTCQRCQCSRNSIQNPGWLKSRRIRGREKLALDNFTKLRYQIKIQSMAIAEPYSESRMAEQVKNEQCLLLWAQYLLILNPIWQNVYKYFSLKQIWRRENRGRSGEGNSANTCLLLTRQMWCHQHIWDNRGEQTVSRAHNCLHHVIDR